MSLSNQRVFLAAKPPPSTPPSPIDETHTPAHSSLKLQLNASDAHLSLGKKKSWMGTLRSVVQKGALQAKAAVDSWRGEPSESKQDWVDAGGSQSRSSSPSRESAKSAASTTLKAGRKPRSHVTTSKSAISSLRHHLPGHTSRFKRRGIDEITAAAPPEAWEPHVSELPHTNFTPRRQGSVASHLVDSLRGMGRVDSMLRSATKAASREILPEIVALPSSPIDIPSAAPALELDLGPSAFTATTFSSSPQKQRGSDGASGPGFGSTSPALPAELSGDLPSDLIPNIYRLGTVTPRTLGGESLGSYILPASADSALPMPGTLFTLDIDGANDSKYGDDADRVFERSVTPTSIKCRNELRNMRSLNALTEACAATHRTDDTAHGGPTADDQGGSPQSAVKEELDSNGCVGPPKLLYPSHMPVRASTEVRPSASTIDSLPFDLPELARHGTEEASDSDRIQNRLSPGRCVDQVQISSLVSPDGPPSPTKSMNLPFRFKIRQHRECSTDSANVLLAISGSDLEPGKGDPLIETTAAPCEDRAPLDVTLGSSVREDSVTAPATQHGPTNRTEETSAAHRTPCRPAYVVECPPLVNMDHYHSESIDAVHESRNTLETSLLLRADPRPSFPKIEYHTETSHAGVKSGPRIVLDQESSSQHVSLETWLESVSTPYRTEQQPDTPVRTSLDCSVYSVSTSGERKSPEISPASSTPGRAPSMGNQLDFELKRSERNMRYNSIQFEPVQNKIISTDPSLKDRKPLRFVVHSSAGPEAYELELSKLDQHVGSSPVDATDESQHFRGGSDESFTRSLINAVSDMDLLHRQLEDEESGIDLSVNVSDSAPDVEPGQHDPGYYEGRVMRSGTPSPEKRIPRDLDSSPVIHSSGSASPARTVISSDAVSPKSPQRNPNSLDTTSLSIPTSPSPMSTEGTKPRIGSADTLDQSLDLFDPGNREHKGDHSSAGDKSPSRGKPTPVRYRSLRRKMHEFD